VLCQYTVLAFCQLGPEYIQDRLCMCGFPKHYFLC
jgi:hypothetical protein